MPGDVWSSNPDVGFEGPCLGQNPTLHGHCHIVAYGCHRYDVSGLCYFCVVLLCGYVIWSSEGPSSTCGVSTTPGTSMLPYQHTAILRSTRPDLPARCCENFPSSYTLCLCSQCLPCQSTVTRGSGMAGTENRACGVIGKACALLLSGVYTVWRTRSGGAVVANTFARVCGAMLIIRKDLTASCTAQLPGGLANRCVNTSKVG